MILLQNEFQDKFVLKKKDEFQDQKRKQTEKQSKGKKTKSIGQNRKNRRKMRKFVR